VWVSPGVCALKALVDHLVFSLLLFRGVSQGKCRGQAAGLCLGGHTQQPRGERAEAWRPSAEAAARGLEKKL